MPDITLESGHTAVLIAYFFAEVHEFLTERIFPRQPDVVSPEDVIRALGAV
ncbi:MAG: hypothetical protein J4N85_12085 [Chloroflexi bacterium]|nr:hypothetical protein [Chloroflexota bacterium]